jgi:hypothetical protein
MHGRYKMVCSWKGAAWSLQSPDGILWKPMAAAPAYTGSDTGQVAFWSERDDSYLAYRRTRGPPAGGRQCHSCAGGGSDHPDGAAAICNIGQLPSRQVSVCASKDLALFEGCSQVHVIRKKRISFALPVYTENDHCAKTGSGQT